MVTSQSNFNCSMFPNASVPGDFVRLLSVNGNDSHAEPGSALSGSYSIACKSNITTIGSSCAGNYINAAQLAKLTDSHVSVDNTYANLQCFNASSEYTWFYDVSSSTPSGYECIFAVSQMNDAHVYDCGHASSTYNVNLKINQTILPNCPVITSPGTYVMTADFKGAPNDAPEIGGGQGVCVKIAAPNVIFDCNGHRITYNGTGSVINYGIVVNGSGAGAQIRNCAGISGYHDGITVFRTGYVTINNVVAYNESQYGIHMLYASNNTVTNSVMHSSGDGVQLWTNFGGVSSNNTFINNVVYNNTWYGFSVYQSPNNTFRNNLAYDNLKDGFWMPAVENNTFINNTVRGNHEYGFDLLSVARYNNFTNNTVTNNSMAGFIMDSSSNNTFMGNRVYRNPVYGFGIRNGAKSNIFIGNIVHNNTFDGFSSGTNCDDNRYLNNTVCNNSASGISVVTGARAVIANNTLCNNTDYGVQLWSSSGSIVADNRISNNSNFGVFVTSSQNCSVIRNVIANSTNAGIYASSSPLSNVSGNTFRANGDGVAIMSGSRNSTVSGNLLEGNAGVGVSVTTSENVTAGYNNISGSYHGIYIEGTFGSPANNTRLVGNRIYNSTRAFRVRNSDISPLLLTMEWGLFFNIGIGGTVENYTNISVSDNVGLSDDYIINWSSNSVARPVGRGSFGNKFVNITRLAGAGSIDSIIWRWTDAELAGSDESRFELYKWNSTIGWSLLNNTPDVSGNTLSQVNLNPASDYGILERAINCPVITSPGTYYQPMDYEGAPNSAGGVHGIGPVCLGINSNNVIFDCNGFTISDNETAGVRAGILINTSLVNVTIRNCDVSGYNYSVYVADSNHTVLSMNMVFNSSNSGIVLSESFNATIINNTARNSSLNGFMLDGSGNSTLINNTAFYNKQRGFRLDPSSSYNRISNNSAFNNSEDGFAVLYGSSYNNLTNNTAHDNGWKGFRVEESSTGNRLVNNTAAGDDEDGFAVISSTGNYLQGNIASGSGWSGFRIEDSYGQNTVFNNTAYGASNYGFYGAASSNFSFINNTAFSCSSGGLGVNAVENATISNNTLYSSSSGMVLVSLGNSSVVGNLVRDSWNYGLLLIFGGRNNISAGSIYGSPRSGIYVRDTDLNTISMAHLYNNSPGITINTTDAVSRSITARYLIFDNPSGTMQNFTNLSLYDSFSSSQAYFINWTVNPPVFIDGRRSFRDKWVNISNLTAGVSIDTLSLHWDESELSGYAESRFELWKHNASSGWTLMNSTPDTALNNLSIKAESPSSFYGILESPVNCPIITAPGLYYQPMDYTGAPNSASEILAGATACVKIASSDVVFDCNGYTITGTSFSSTFGIVVNGSASVDFTNVTVRNCGGISGYGIGMYGYDSGSLLVYNVTSFNSSYGFRMDRSRDGVFTNNTAYNLTESGFFVNQSVNFTLLNNNASGTRFAILAQSSNRSRFINNTGHSSLYGLEYYSNCYNNSAEFNAAYNNTFTGVVDNGGMGNNWTGNVVWNSSNYGIYLSSVGVRLEGNLVHSIEGVGIEVDGGSSFLYSNVVYNNTGYAGFGIGSDFNNLSGNMAYNNSEYGFRIDSCSGNNLTDNRAYNNSMGGFLLSGSANSNRLHLNIAVNNTAVSVNVSSSDSNNFTNNTFESSRYGVWLDASSTGNLFYFNDFLNSTFAHAYAAVSGNFFNTTNTSSCPVAWNYCARGNYWDDISTLDIRDNNIDGFGDQGSEYPYSRANNANVSTNVVDEGPIVTGVVDFVPPNGSITIYGPNGTIITGTRSVFLNLSYSDDQCIHTCRWANDAEANLNSQLWENCTTVKPWLLSEGEGNKTVYFEVRDCAGNNNISNDSIIYQFMQDYTAPTAPIVFDGDTGIDIDWSSDNTSLSAYWWNATDDISTIYYRYRILNDSVCMFGNCGWTDAGPDDSVSVSGFSLEECSNYSFQVMVYNPSGFNSSIATSNGTTIDLTRPALPVINSSTHPDPATTYGTGTVKLNFTSSDPGSCPSGIEGYSYILDQYPGTAPDSNLESRFLLPLSSMQNDGSAQLLRAGSGIISPNTYAVFSQVRTNLSVNDVMRVRVALVEIGNDTTDLMGVSVYLISGTRGFSVTNFNNYNRAVANVVNVTRDIRYSENMQSAAVYTFELAVNSTIDENGNDTYVVIAGMPGDTDNRNNLSIAAAATGVDNTTQTWVCNDSNSCTNTTSWLDFAIEVKLQDSGASWDVQYDNLPDGTYYFHAKAKDIAGNWGDTAHYNFTVDTGGISVDILSPFTGQVFVDENITVTVRVEEQANVTVIALHPDGSNDTSDWKVFADTDTLNVSLENGSNTLYARAVNPENGVVTFSQRVYVILGTEVAAGNRTFRVSYAGAGQFNHIYSTDEGTMRVGFATENDTFIPGAGSLVTDTGRYTIKIFATTDQLDLSRVDDDLDDDDFLDRVSPMFGYEKGVSYYILRTEVRPLGSYLSGDARVTSGTRTLILKNVGYTPDGKANITVRII